MFLKVKPKNNTLNLGIYSKLESRYRSLFVILEKIRTVAYEIAFPRSIKLHNVFHVSLLKRYVHDPRNIIEWNMIHANCRVDDFFLH